MTAERPDWLPKGQPWEKSPAPQWYSTPCWQGMQAHTFAPKFSDIVDINPYPQGTIEFEQLIRGYLSAIEEEEAINRAEALCS